MLRLSLWGLEALFKVNNTLSASVRVLESAIADLKKEMKDVSGLAVFPQSLERHEGAQDR